MAKDAIFASDEATEATDNEFKRITRTTVGSKEALDVAVKEGAPATPHGGSFVTWTVDASPDYSDGDQVGDVEEFDASLTEADGTLTLESIILIDDDKLNFDVDVLVFDSQPTVTSSDNGALAMTVANLQKCRARVRVRECDWSELDGQSIADVTVGRPVKGANSDDSLYVILQARGTINFVSTGGVSLALNTLRD